MVWSSKNGSGGSSSGTDAPEPEKEQVLVPYGMGRRMECTKRYRHQEWIEKNGLH